MKEFLKRLCVFMIVTAMTLSIMPVSAASKTNDGCALTSGELNLLKKLEIISDTTDFDRGFTRGELAVSVAKLMKLEGNTSYTESMFYDVPTDSEYYPYVCALVVAGILSGDGNGYFRPNDTVQFNEICKVLTIPLGYGILGDFTSYHNAARIAGIVDSVVKNTSITVGTAYEMLYRALHAGMFEPYMFGETTEYKVNPNETALKRFHNLVKKEGIADGIYGTTLIKAESSALSDELLINGKAFKCKNPDEYFGYSVVYYLSATDEAIVPQIQYIYADDSINSTLKVDAENIISKDDATFKYYNNNDKVTHISVNPYMDVIYNGISYASCPNQEFIPEAGSVTFIDNNGDEKYDVIKIDSYEYAVVEGVDNTNNIIYVKYGDATAYGKAENREAEIDYKVDGYPAYLVSLSQGTVIAARQSKGSTGPIVTKIDVISDSLSGKISSISDKSITIDGKKLPLAKNYITDAADKGGIQVGTTVVAYTHKGRVVAIIHEKTDEFTLGYLVAAAETGESFGSVVKLRIMCKDKTFRDYECVEKVNIDGVRESNSTTVLTRLAAAASNTYRDTGTSCPRNYSGIDDSRWVYSQLINYKVNSAGKISHIDTNYYDAARELDTSLRLEKPAEKLYYFPVSQSFNYSGTTGAFDFYIGAGVESWRVPIHEKDKAVFYAMDITFSRKSYIIEAYNVKDYKADIVLFYEEQDLTMNESIYGYPYVVSDEYIAIDENGEVARYLELKGSGTSILKLSNDVFNADLEVGDVIKYTHDRAGNNVKFYKMIDVGSEDIFDATRVYNFKNRETVDRLSEYRLVMGTVTNINDEMLFHTTSMLEDDGGFDPTQNFAGYVKGGNVYIYDRNAQNPGLKAGSLSDIITYKMNPAAPDKVIMTTASGGISYIYILRGWE